MNALKIGLAIIAAASVSAVAQPYPPPYQSPPVIIVAPQPDPIMGFFGALFGIPATILGGIAGDIGGLVPVVPDGRCRRPCEKSAGRARPIQFRQRCRRLHGRRQGRPTITLPIKKRASAWSRRPAIPLNEKLATLLKSKKATLSALDATIRTTASRASWRPLPAPWRPSIGTSQVAVAIACSLAIAIAASAGAGAHAAPNLGNSPDSRCEGVIIIAEDNGWAPSLEQQEAEYQRCVAALEHGEVHPSRR